ncbi:hemerythrin domain-containing protein [Bdellovibrionota bacterium FG-1]
MDVLDLLKADHERFRSMFDQFNTETGRQQQILIFENIRNELENLTRVKEQVFYPVFKDFPEFKEVLAALVHDHASDSRLIQGVTHAIEAGHDLRRVGHELIIHTLRHFDDEEAKLYPLVRKVIKRPERERLGRHFQTAKLEFSRSAA